MHVLPATAGILGLLLAAACGPAPANQPAGRDGPVPARESVFGTAIVDLVFTVDDAARQSLVATPDANVPATMTFRDEAGATRTGAVTMHIKGQRGSSRPLDDKPAFKVDLGPGTHIFGLDHLTLNNMVQDTSMLHEALGYEVYAAAGVEVPATGYARVTFNGRDLGLYLNLETTDKRFLSRRFGDAGGILYEGSYGVDLRMEDVGAFESHEGTDPGRARLTDLIHAINAPGDGVFYGAEARVDTASFLGMMAAAALLGDWDNYYTSNNYRLYWSPRSGQWHFIPTGIDETFASSIGVFESTGLLFQKCLASERCTTDYAMRVRDVASHVAHLGLLPKMEALAAVIGAAAPADPRPAYDAAHVTAARDEMRAFIGRRPSEVLAALSCLDGGHEKTLGACAGVVAANLGTGQCLDAGTVVAVSGATVGASACLGRFNQHWHVVAAGTGVRLAAMRGGKCLEARRGSAHQGAPLVQSDCSRSDDQIFDLRASPGGVQIVARTTGRCVAVAPEDSGDARVIQVDCAADPAQRWRVGWSVYVPK